MLRLKIQSWRLRWKSSAKDWSLWLRSSTTSTAAMGSLKPMNPTTPFFIIIRPLLLLITTVSSTHGICFMWTNPSWPLQTCSINTNESIKQFNHHHQSLWLGCFLLSCSWIGGVCVMVFQWVEERKRTGCSFFIFVCYQFAMIRCNMLLVLSGVLGLGWRWRNMITKGANWVGPTWFVMSTVWKGSYMYIFYFIFITLPLVLC